MKNKILNKISTPVLAILALILFGATIGTAAPGDLDLSFGSGGFVFTPIVDPPDPNYFASSGTARVQPDGKIVVCGQVIFSDGEMSFPVSFFLARYNPAGTLDASFGTNGKIIASYSSNGFTGIDLALQPDGKIVLAVATSNGFTVYRYNANGTLDPSFGTGGVVVTPVGNLFGIARSVAIQADGKIVAAGYSSPLPDNYDFTVVRYNPDGSLDTSFNGTGKVITSFGGNSFTNKVVIQPDGKIVAVGDAVPENGTRAFALVRYNADGSLDSGFGTGGKVIHAVSPGINIVHDAVLQPDGKIVVSGTISVVAGIVETAIVRYNANGSIDTSFATSGVFTTEDSFRVSNGIALQPNGKLLAFGNSGGGFAILRLNPNGTPDTGFGTNGRVITLTGTGSITTDGAVQSDSKILAFGTNVLPNANSRGIVIVRHLGDSAIQRPAQFDFDGDRRADVAVFRPSDRVWYLNRSTQGFSATQFGLSTDKITPADFDGDGRTDIAVFRDGVWYWLNSSNGNFNAVQFGISSDIPVPSDYTGDGRAELAVYRNGTWWIQDLTGNQTQVVNFGLASDKPVPADYNGDGRTDQAVYRGSGEWHLNCSIQGYKVIQFGLPADKPVPADYDGDGKADLAVYRNGTWYLLQSTNGFAAFNWGISSDIPAPADYDGDGRTDAAVFRDGIWYLRQTTSGISVQQFGLTNDKPVPSAFLP
jgi:uncharacterized delta-60 repeat protein